MNLSSKSLKSVRFVVADGSNKLRSGPASLNVGCRRQHYNSSVLKRADQITVPSGPSSTYLSTCLGRERDADFLL